MRRGCRGSRGPNREAHSAAECVQEVGAGSAECPGDRCLCFPWDLKNWLRILALGAVSGSISRGGMNAGHGAPRL